MVAPHPAFGGGHRIWADGWDGYPQDRERLLEVLRAQQIGGEVFLGGDLMRTGPTTCKLPRATPWRPSSSVPASR